jgi:Zn-finger nucleic acid-binding protein
MEEDSKRSNREGSEVKKEINLGFCPRCKSDFHEGGEMMTRVVKGVRFCYLCSFDLEENKIELNQWVSWAKEYAKNMGRAKP